MAGGAQATAAKAPWAAATALPTVPTTARTVSADSGAPRSRPSTSAACRYGQLAPHEAVKSRSRGERCPAPTTGTNTASFG